MKATRWSKLRSLSFAEVWFLVEATAAVVAFDLALRLFSSKTCLAVFESKGAELTPPCRLHRSPVKDAMLGEYEVSAEDLWEDLQDLVVRLADSGLVEVIDEGDTVE